MLFSIQPASAIPFDNSVNGLQSLCVQAAVEESLIKNINFEASSAVSTTTINASAVLMAGMTLTPGAGTYLVLFSASITCVTVGASTTLSIFANGVEKADSVRTVSPFDGGSLSSGTGTCGININGIVTIGALQTIEIRWLRSAGLSTVGQRTLNLIRVG